MADVVILLLPFFGIIFLGYFGGRIWKNDETGLDWLNAFIIYFAFPAMFYQLISRTPLDQLANWRFFFVTTLATYLVFAISFSYAAFRKGNDLAEAAVMGLIGSYGNIGYLGPPLAFLALGPDAVIPVALIFCLEVTLCFTLAPLLVRLNRGSDGDGGITLASVPLKIILHPLIIATLLGVAGATWQIKLPDAVDQILTMLQSAAIPSALFAFGVTIGLRPIRGMQGELSVLIAIKMLLHPLIVYCLLIWIGGFDTLWVHTAVLMACLPPAAAIFVLAKQYGAYELGASSAALIGTVGAVLTLTAVLYLMKTDRLPEGLFSVVQPLISLT